MDVKALTIERANVIRVNFIFSPADPAALQYNFEPFAEFRTLRVSGPPQQTESLLADDQTPR